MKFKQVNENQEFVYKCYFSLLTGTQGGSGVLWVVERAVGGTREEGAVPCLQALGRIGSAVWSGRGEVSDVGEEGEEGDCSRVSEEPGLDNQL